MQQRYWEPLLLLSRSWIHNTWVTTEHVHFIHVHLIHQHQSCYVCCRLVTNSIKLGQYTISPGNIVMSSIYLLHNSRLNWEEPDVFRPERFLVANADLQLGGGKAHRFAPFGYGPKNCLGQVRCKACSASTQHSLQFCIRVQNDLSNK